MGERELELEHHVTRPDDSDEVRELKRVVAQQEAQIAELQADLAGEPSHDPSARIGVLVYTVISAAAIASTYTALRTSQTSSMREPTRPALMQPERPHVNKS